MPLEFSTRLRDRSETGRLNKEIAGDLGITEITVKVHRAQAMRKMGADSLPEPARMADKLKLPARKPRNTWRSTIYFETATELTTSVTPGT